MSFATNVFINCPFDREYQRMRDPLLFTIIRAGLHPRIALESLDSAQPRIQKIVGLIRESRFGIHDLSRLQAEGRGTFSRLNMPLELGIDVGCRMYGTKRHREKRCLILEAERYRFQAAISDLSGSDIGVHNNEPRQLVSVVRSWLHDEADVDAGGANEIYVGFTNFVTENCELLRARGFSAWDIANLSVKELIRCMHSWNDERTRRSRRPCARKHRVDAT
jgi:hypothetical protein